MNEVTRAEINSPALVDRVDSTTLETPSTRVERTHANQRAHSTRRTNATGRLVLRRVFVDDRDEI